MSITSQSMEMQGSSLQNPVGWQNEVELQAPSLLAHLNSRLTAFEQERAQFLARLDAVLVSHPLRISQVHTLRHARDEYLNLLQAVSESKVQLLEEQRKKIDLHNTYESVIKKQENHQRKMVEMAAGTKIVPEVQQSVELKQGKRPSRCGLYCRSRY